MGAAKVPMCDEHHTVTIHTYLQNRHVITEDGLLVTNIHQERVVHTWVPCFSQGREQHANARKGGGVKFVMYVAVAPCAARRGAALTMGLSLHLERSESTDRRREPQQRQAGTAVVTERFVPPVHFQLPEHARSV